MFVIYIYIYIYTHFWKEYAERSNFFIIFVTNKLFKILFTKRKLIRYYSCFNIHIVYRNRTYIDENYILQFECHEFL